MGQKNPTELAKKWRDNLVGSQSQIIAGVKSITTSPMEQAAMAKDKMKANLLKSIDSGKWEAGLRSVPLQRWQEITVRKLSSNLQAGADAAQPNMATFLGELIPYQASYLSELHAMPSLTQVDSENRMLANMRKMSAFSYKRRSS